MNWLIKIMQRTDLHDNSQGTGDGGLEVGGRLFPGQSQLFTGGRNVHKKNRKRTERPGEPHPQNLLILRKTNS